MLKRLAFEPLEVLLLYAGGASVGVLSCWARPAPKAALGVVARGGLAGTFTERLQLLA